MKMVSLIIIEQKMEFQYQEYNTIKIQTSNKKLKKPIKIYGLTNPQYVSSKLNKLDFK
jgi:hypothetical protein